MHDCILMDSCLNIIVFRFARCRVFPEGSTKMFAAPIKPHELIAEQEVRQIIEL